jgi:hypothetical protein
MHVLNMFVKKLVLMKETMEKVLITIQNKPTTSFQFVSKNCQKHEFWP